MPSLSSRLIIACLLCAPACGDPAPSPAEDESSTGSDTTSTTTATTSTTSPGTTPVPTTSPDTGDTTTGPGDTTSTGSTGDASTGSTGSTSDASTGSTSDASTGSTSDASTGSTSDASTGSTSDASTGGSTTAGDPCDAGDGPVFTITNNGFTDYVINGVNDPPLTLVRGCSYTFDVNAPGHPFFINSVQGVGVANAYNDGVMNNGVSVGVITWDVSLAAPNSLFYNCQFHPGMTGTITIIDP